MSASLVSGDAENRERQKLHLDGLLQNILGVDPDTFDANFRTAESPLVHITVTSRGKRDGIDV